MVVDGNSIPWSGFNPYLGYFECVPFMHGSGAWPDTWIKFTYRTWVSPFSASFPSWILTPPPQFLVALATLTSVLFYRRKIVGFLSELQLPYPTLRLQPSLRQSCKTGNSPNASPFNILASLQNLPAFNHSLESLM